MADATTGPIEGTDVPTESAVGVQTARGSSPVRLGLHILIVIGTSERPDAEACAAVPRVGMGMHPTAVRTSASYMVCRSGCTWTTSERRSLTR